MGCSLYLAVEGIAGHAVVDVTNLYVSTRRQKHLVREARRQISGENGHEGRSIDATYYAIPRHKLTTHET